MNTTKEDMYRLWRKYEPLWTSWAIKLCYVDYEVEDLCQESYFLFLKALEHYDGTKGVPFESYYKIILYRWGKKYSNRKRTENIGDEALGYYLDQMEAWIDFGEELYKKERLSRLMEVLELLSPMEQAIITKFYFKHNTLKEIGQALNLTPKAVAMRKERILQKLNKLF